MNAFGRANKADGVEFPAYTDAWRVLVGALVIMVLRQTFFVMLTPMALSLSKEQENEDLRRKYAKKMLHMLFNFCYFSVSATWGWSVLKDKPSLPWYIGGAGSLKNFTLGTVFLDFDPAVYHYSLYTMGFHVQNGFTHVFLDERMNDY